MKAHMAMRKTASTATKEDKEDRFNTFVYAVFLAVVLGAGSIIWNLIKSDAALSTRVAVLEVKCFPPVTRGGH